MVDFPEFPLNEIEQKIFQAVHDAIRQPQSNADPRPMAARLMNKWSSSEPERRDGAIREVWTREIIRKLHVLGNRLGYRSETSHTGQTGLRGGWMYDLIWRDLNTGGDWWVVNGVPLVLVCDWYVSEINFPNTDALGKLMVARATHRVMIIQSRHIEGAFDRAAMFLDQCEMVPAKERYLFIGYDQRDDRLRWRVHLAQSRWPNDEDDE